MATHCAAAPVATRRHAVAIPPATALWAIALAARTLCASAASFAQLWDALDAAAAHGAPTAAPAAPVVDALRSDPPGTHDYAARRLLALLAAGHCAAFVRTADALWGGERRPPCVSVSRSSSGASLASASAGEGDALRNLGRSHSGASISSVSTTEGDAGWRMGRALLGAGISTLSGTDGDAGRTLGRSSLSPITGGASDASVRRSRSGQRLADAASWLGGVVGRRTLAPLANPASPICGSAGPSPVAHRAFSFDALSLASPVPGRPTAPLLHVAPARLAHPALFGLADADSAGTRPWPPERVLLDAQCYARLLSVVASQTLAAALVERPRLVPADLVREALFGGRPGAWWLGLSPERTVDVLAIAARHEHTAAVEDYVAAAFAPARAPGALSDAHVCAVLRILLSHGPPSSLDVLFRSAHYVPARHGAALLREALRDGAPGAVAELVVRGSVVPTRALFEELVPASLSNPAVAMSVLRLARLAPTETLAALLRSSKHRHDPLVVRWTARAAVAHRSESLRAESPVAGASPVRMRQRTGNGRPPPRLLALAEAPDERSTSRRERSAGRLVASASAPDLARAARTADAAQPLLVPAVDDRVADVLLAALKSAADAIDGLRPHGSTAVDA